MKIRSGFVSNSSSSSFIISDKDFKTTGDLVKYMIKKQIKENRNYDYDWKDDAINCEKNYIKRAKKLSDDQSVSFPSCNYDTYIKKVGDCYLVSTCNNTDWDLYSYATKLSDVAKESLTYMRDSYDEDTEEYDNINELLSGEYEDFYAIGNDYYALDKELIGVETYDYCPNEKTHNSYTHLWDLPKYGKVCLICNPIFKRKDKLDQINKASEE